MTLNILSITNHQTSEPRCRMGIGGGGDDDKTLENAKKSMRININI
jgi:hypothetical protein